MFFVRFPYSYNLTVGKEAGGGRRRLSPTILLCVTDIVWMSNTSICTLSGCHIHCVTPMRTPRGYPMYGGHPCTPTSHISYTLCGCPRVPEETVPEARRKIRENLLRAQIQHLTHCIDVRRHISDNLTQCRDVIGGDSRRYTSAEEIFGDIPPIRISTDTTYISALIYVVSVLIRIGGISPKISSAEVYLRESPPMTSRHCVRLSEICLRTSIQCVRCCI
jgi:hypothetical protein